MARLTLLVASDFHYSRGTDRMSPSALGPEWVRRIALDAQADGSPDAFVLLGDLAEDGSSPLAERDLAAMAAAVREVGLPAIVVPGNHDGDAGRCLRIFGDHAGAHEVKGYNLFSVVDSYDEEGRWRRSADALDALGRAGSRAPLILLQHPILFPDVDCSEYPYLAENAEEVRQACSRAGVFLSISGHYHEGVPLTRYDGVWYLTCGAVVRPPHRYYLVTLEDGAVHVEERSLGFKGPVAIHDGHTHSHFGYCAEDVHPEKSLERATLLGLAGLTCLEHAGQLYLSRDDYWRWAHVEDVSAIVRARKTPENRMPAFRSAMMRFRSPSLLVGLEVECDREGRLNLLDEDREGWDVLLGAVHVIPSSLPCRTAEERARSFMRIVEWLLRGGVDVLAHPLRLFEAKGLPPPRDMYRPLARLLRAHDTGAEVNFHNNRPDPEFFRICAEEGVRLTLGSDAHRLDEVGALQPHLRLLKQIGIPLPSCTGGR